MSASLIQLKQLIKQSSYLLANLSPKCEESSSSVSREEVDSSAEFVELAREIEPQTCGLQFDSDQSDTIHDELTQGKTEEPEESSS